MDSSKDTETPQNTDQHDLPAATASVVKDTPAEDKVMVVDEEEQTPAVENKGGVEKEEGEEDEEAAEKEPMLTPTDEVHQGEADVAVKEQQKEEETEPKQNGIHSGGESERVPREVTPIPPVEVTSEKCTKPPTCCSLSYGTARKVLIGVSIGLAVAISWVAATQFIKAMYSSENFDSPYFTIWFSTSWMLVCYPIYIIGSLVIFKDQRNAGFAGIKELFRDDQQIYGPRGMTLRNCLKLTGPFCALWVITNDMHAAALKFNSPTDDTAVFVTNTAIIYIFSWFWLEELLILLPVRLCSVILSVLGTVLMMYAEGFSGVSVNGAVLALGAAIGAALYKVLFKRFLGDATYGQVSLFLTMLSLLNLILLWPIMIGLVFISGRETLLWSDLPWGFLCGTSALGIVFNFLVNFGIALTHPLLISLANIVGIPINAVIDTVIADLRLGPLKIVGALLIIAGFLIMLLPEPWQAKVYCWKEGEEPCRRKRHNMHRIPSVELDVREAGDNAARV